jgi:hypothetical protein
VDAVEFIRDVTYKMCDRDFDLDLVESTFADDFVHHGNGATTDRAGYLARGREYREVRQHRPPAVRRALPDRRSRRRRLHAGAAPPRRLDGAQDAPRRGVGLTLRAGADA